MNIEKVADDIVKEFKQEDDYARCGPETLRAIIVKHLRRNQEPDESVEAPKTVLLSEGFQSPNEL